ncbi:15290_t:CDS:2 [Funneliformis geosporum]|uniref:4489_t:CDS:1 n=1 Tax=Funneliformis geosporum TaxID=1117311 RepID=A0A9W4WUI7_9GLOM|nr:4489_t:CDS:2 [Funneliformis geosporum]CAI2183063.1 15290_t:CDS:2 [Funneliformis geosporum]
MSSINMDTITDKNSIAGPSLPTTPSSTSITTLILPKDLQKVYDDLNPSERRHYARQNSDEDRMAFLEVIQAATKKAKKEERKKGEFIIEIFASSAVLFVIISLIVLNASSNASSKNEFYELSSYIITYLVQFLAIILELTSGITLVGPEILFSDIIS